LELYFHKCIEWRPHLTDCYQQMIQFVFENTLIWFVHKWSFLLYQKNKNCKKEIFDQCQITLEGTNNNQCSSTLRKRILSKNENRKISMESQNKIGFNIIII
jgi:hypothetical protein